MVTENKCNKDKRRQKTPEFQDQIHMKVGYFHLFLLNNLEKCKNG